MIALIIILGCILGTILGSGITVGAVSAIGRVKKEKGITSCTHHKFPSLYDCAPRKNCKREDHQLYPSTVSDIIQYKPAWLLIGFLWPLVLTTIILYVPSRIVFNLSSRGTHWLIREIVSPNNNVKEIES